MVAQSRINYPALKFQLADATALPFDAEFDAVFSNAVLHWVRPKYSGEFTDADRFYFVLESPHAQAPAPDMDAIRRELEAKERAANAVYDTWLR